MSTRRWTALFGAVFIAAALPQAPVQSGPQPDQGSRIAFARAVGREVPKRYEIFTMAPDGSDVVRLTRNRESDEFPAWSPDGTRIAFASYRDGDSDIYTMGRDGTDVRQVTNRDIGDTMPAWSPDGERIVFITVGKQNRTDLWTVRPDGSRLRRLTKTNADEFFPVWSPNGRRIAVAKFGFKNNHTRISLLSRRGEQVRWLTDPGAFDNHPTWSPDGHDVAFARDLDLVTHLYSVDRKGEVETPVIEGEGHWTAPSWGPDGRIVVMFEGGLGVVDADGSGFTTITPPQSPDTERPYWSPSWGTAVTP